MAYLTIIKGKNSEKFWQIHSKSTKSMKLRGFRVPKLWGGWVVPQVWDLFLNKSVFHRFPIMYYRTARLLFSTMLSRLYIHRLLVSRLYCLPGRPTLCHQVIRKKTPFNAFKDDFLNLAHLLFTRFAWNWPAHFKNHVFCENHTCITIPSHRFPNSSADRFNLFHKHNLEHFASPACLWLFNSFENLILRTICDALMMTMMIHIL